MDNKSLTADLFMHELEQHKNEVEIDRIKRFYKGPEQDGLCLGMNMRSVFQIAKDYTDMPLSEVETLLESRYYEVRMGAVSIMDFQAKRKNIPEDQRKALFELYVRRHDRINNWDFVDRAAYSVVGGYLLDKPRDILYKMANSEHTWERRTAIVSTYAFIKQGDVDDTFRIAEILIHDKEDLIQKAVGSWVREAGKKDETKLKSFLDEHAETMPRVTLRYALEKLDKNTKKYYMSIGK